MGLTSEILRRYRRMTAASGPRITLSFKKTGYSQDSNSFDLRRISGELMRITKPVVTSELRRASADIADRHRKNESAATKRMQAESAKYESARSFNFMRDTRRLEAFAEELREDLAHVRKPSLVRTELKLRRDAPDSGRVLTSAEKPVSLGELERILEKRLSEAAGEFTPDDARRLARLEAEAVFRRFREEEAYERLRGGLR